MDAQAGGWIGLGSLFVMGLFAWLNRRDTLRHDKEIDTLKRDQEECKKESAECKEERTQDRRELNIAKAELAARDVKDKAELQARIDAQQKQIDVLKSQVGSKG